MNKEQFKKRLKIGHACCERGYNHKKCFCIDKQQIAIGVSLPEYYDLNKVDEAAFFAADTVKEMNSILKKAKVWWPKRWWIYMTCAALNNPDAPELLSVDIHLIRYEVTEEMRNK